MSHTLSRVSISLTYPILTNLKKLPTILYPKLIMHGEQIQNESISQNIPRVGGIRSIVLLWTIIGWQEVWKIGKISGAKLNLWSNHFLTSKFKKLLTKNEDLGNSWIGSTSANCPLLKPSSIITNNVLISAICRMLFIPLLIWLSIVKLMLRFLMKLLTNWLLPGPLFQRKNSGLL